MKTKFLSIIIISFFSLSITAQTNIPFYEQIAFDFYKNEIIEKSEEREKYKITQNLKSIFYLSTECLKNKVYNEKEIKKLQNSLYFKGYRLNLSKIDKKTFRKAKKINKNSNKENFVEVSIAYEFEGRIFVVISELNSGQGKDYIFEFNNDGKIIDWCKSSEYTQMIFGL